MTESTFISEDANFSWNFLNYPIHAVSAKPKEIAKDVAILLIHGFGASTDHWRFNIPVLSSKFEVHAMDLLGFGKSPKPNDVEYSGSLWKNQVIAYVKEKIKKPTIIVGNSLGGYAALAAGVDLKDLTAGVILLNAAGYFSEEKLIKKNMLQTSVETVAGIFLKNIVLQRLIFENMRKPSTIKKTLNQVYINKTNVDDFLVNSIRQPSLDIGAFNVFRSVFNPSGPQGEPLDELFKKLASPLLLLWGSKDPWMNTPKKRGLYEKFTPKNTTEIILEAGHCPHDEVPELVNKNILDWAETL
ncbi:MAG: alpha/beta hydrolase [Prochlorococcus sp. SP3034]|nr:alpha/beta hydrolase [Prochlorococcus sp. SP3034]|tara:strand:+ start:5186 stop:6085 length:900 start_codon:yes stop_codon:yes gene_type:complete